MRRQTISKKGLLRHLGERVAFWEQGSQTHKIFDALWGNEMNEVEAGIFLRDRNDFYVRVVKREGYEISYRRGVCHDDGIAIKSRVKYRERDIRFYRVNLS